MSGEGREPTPTCPSCGLPARGYAVIGRQRYCHSDDAYPSCYMRALWKRSTAAVRSQSVIRPLTVAALTLSLLAVATPASAHNGWCGHGTHIHVSFAPERINYRGHRTTRRTGHDHYVRVAGPGYAYLAVVDCPRHR